jgi:transcriptional regulator with XRE-family HTH domain
MTKVYFSRMKARFFMFIDLHAYNFLGDLRYQRANSPTVSTLEAICHAFGMSLAQFFSNTEENSILTRDQKELLKKWVLLTQSQKEKVMAYILGCLQQ